MSNHLQSYNLMTAFTMSLCVLQALQSEECHILPCVTSESWLGEPVTDTCHSPESGFEFPETKQIPHPLRGALS